MMYEGLVLISFGCLCIIIACVLVSKGYGKPLIGSLSKGTRKAIGIVTKRFTRK